MVKKRIITGMLFTLLCIFIWEEEESPMQVYASPMTQSANQIVVELEHTHSQEACYETVWVPCGGHWNTNFEPSVMATVYYCSNAASSETVNGVPLSSIHTGWVYSEMHGVHAGEYANTCICTEHTMGELCVTREITEDEVILHASLMNQSELLTEYSISWGSDELTTLNGDCEMQVSQNGVYTAEVDWYDSKEEAWHHNEISYTEVSIPIKLHFMDGENQITEMNVTYGQPLSAVTVPTKVGYTFNGFFLNDEAVYLKDGTPQRNEPIEWEQQDISVNASWSPKHYIIKYGEDADCDGIPDEAMEVVYGEPYDSIVPPTNSNGSNFGGYYWNNEEIFDANGNSLGLWNWDYEEGTAIEALWVSNENNVNSRTEGAENSTNVSSVASQNQLSTGTTLSSNTGAQEEDALNDNTPLNIEENVQEEQKDVETESSISIDAISADKVGKGEIVTSQTENTTEVQAEHYSSTSVAAPIDDPQNDKNRIFNTIIKVGTITLVSVAGIWGLLWCWLYLFSMTTIWSIQPDGTSHLLGKRPIYTWKGILKVTIRESFLEKCLTDRIRLEIPQWYVDMTKNKELHIVFPKHTTVEYVKHRVEVKVCNS